MKKNILCVLMFLLLVFCISCTGPSGLQGPEGPTTPGLYYVKIFQQGVYPSVYTGQVQTTLYNGITSAYYTNVNNPIDLGWLTPGHKYRTIIKFNLSSLPTTKIMIDKAELILKTNSTGNSGGAADVTVHRVVGMWDPTYAGWQVSTETSSWPMPGGDYQEMTMTPEAASYDIDTDSTVTIPISPSVVQDWVTQAGVNHGMIFISKNISTDNLCQIYSSGSTPAANRPMLKVWYYTTE